MNRMKPIIFSAPMAVAILEGRKTQTRRVIKDRDITNWFDIDVDGKPIAYIDQETGDSNPPTHRAKYQPGDILWVRETWARASSGIIEYKADYKEPFTDSTEIDHTGYKIKWRPSIFMPREAARIFLKVKGVRVERVQEITEDDAIAEGVGDLFFEEIGYSNNPKYDLPMEGETLGREQFELLWNSINAKRGYGWESNPWVWVYEFERAEVEK